MHTQERLARALQAHAKFRREHGDLGLKGCAGCRSPLSGYGETVTLGRVGCSGCSGLLGCAGCQLGALTTTGKVALGAGALAAVAGAFLWWRSR